MIPVPKHPYAEPQAWTAENGSSLPGTGAPYFLRNGRGPSAVLGGTVVRPIARGGDTDGLFTLGSIEGSKTYETQALDSTFLFYSAPHFFFVAEGYFKVIMDGKPSTRIGPTESFFVPAGIKFHVEVDSRYAKLFVYSTPRGLNDLLYEAGNSDSQVGPNCMIPEKGEPWNKQKLNDLKGRYEFELS